MPVKIVPADGAEPGEPFTILDTDQGRLGDGSVALFTKSPAVVDIGLRTHAPYKTAQGRLPTTLGGGTYEVSVRRSDGSTFAVGSFNVLAPELGEPTIQPVSGIPGSTFTITDPQARIQQGDLAILYQEGTDPAMGTPASGIEVSADGKTIRANVPATVLEGYQHFVSVRPSSMDAPRFGDLAFFVLAG
ncbi:MAG: hypothetical protein HY903_04705 [Deltaproteobacteria bacterium]|nr:hypothetical protein [Deltaproteobacteria bacterium]